REGGACMAAGVSDVSGGIAGLSAQGNAELNGGNGPKIVGQQSAARPNGLIGPRTAAFRQ
ncbi:hypothetical protein, partial [Synechococcus lacustris]|uniref:hypothetical protein n=1 Tax=Synechococcus lacustris TaxID=2116544 RepID=UPI0019D4B5FE